MTDEAPPKKKEIYTYKAPWTTFSMGWCRRPDTQYRIAVGSYIEEYANKFHIVQLDRSDSKNSTDTNTQQTSKSGGEAMEHNNNNSGTSSNNSSDSGFSKFTKVNGFDHPYPATKVMWAPSNYYSKASSTDLIATSGDYLRLWSVGDNDTPVSAKSVLNNNKHTGILFFSTNYYGKRLTITVTVSILQYTFNYYLSHYNHTI